MTLRATDGGHVEDDRYVELDCELAVAVANVTEGAARSTVLKVTQVEPSHRFVAWHALVDGNAPKSSNDRNPYMRHLKRRKEAKELKDRLTAWSLRVAEHEHQFKAIDEAQKTFVVRGMMPKDIKREFLTGPRKFDEIMEKLQIIINEMTADDGPVPMDLGSVGTPDAKMAQSGSETSNDMSCDDACGIAWKGFKTGKGTGETGPNGLGDRDKGGTGSKDKGKCKGKSETRYWYCGEEGHIGVNCPSGPRLVVGKVSLKEKRQKNSRALRHLMTR